MVESDAVCTIYQVQSSSSTAAATAVGQVSAWCTAPISRYRFGAIPAAEIAVRAKSIHPQISNSLVSTCNYAHNRYLASRTNTTHSNPSKDLRATSSNHDRGMVALMRCCPVPLGYTAAVPVMRSQLPKQTESQIKVPSHVSTSN